MSQHDQATNSPESGLLLRPEDWPNIDHIQTEDGAPVDGVFSEKQMRLLTGTLYDSWKTDKSFVALANVGLFYGIDLPPVVPDVLLSVNVRLPENLFPKLHRSYFVWKYGKPPEVAIEIVSNKEGGELSRKVDLYGDVRVANYVIYDPEERLSNQPLRLYRLQGSKMVEDDRRPILFPEFGLGLELWHGRFEETDSHWLRWTDSNGKTIPTGGERADQEKQRADEQKHRADEENQRANDEKQRAELLLRETERLYQLLKDKGIDPNSLT